MAIFFNTFMFMILYWPSNTLFLIQSQSGLLGEFVLFLMIPVQFFLHLWGAALGFYCPFFLVV